WRPCPTIPRLSSKPRSRSPDRPELPSMRTILTNASLIDCVDGMVADHATVAIEDGRITKIVKGGLAPASPDATIVDLNGAYLMPGLWDVHIHPDYFSPTELPLP